MSAAAWPAVLGGNNDQWISRWVESNNRERGQVSSGPHGLWHAVNCARIAAEFMKSDVITSAAGEVVYDLNAGIDELPDCPRCGHVCKDPSTHVPAVTR